MTSLWDCWIASHKLKSFSGLNQEDDQMPSCYATPDSKHFTKLLPLSLGILPLSTTSFCFVFAEECFDLAFDGFGIMIQR